MYRMSLQYRNELSQRINMKINEIKDEIKEVKYSVRQHKKYNFLIFKLRYLYEYIEGESRDEFINNILNYNSTIMNDETIVFEFKAKNENIKQNRLLERIFGLKRSDIYDIFIHTLDDENFDDEFLESYKHIGETTFCPITLEDIEDGGKMLKILKCSHSFSEEGLLSWLKQKKECPLCRCKCD